MYRRRGIESMDSRRKRRNRRNGCLSAFIGFCGICGILLAIGIFLFLRPTSQVSEIIRTAFAPIPFQEVTTDQESLSGKYYFQLLSEEDKFVYLELLEGIKGFSEEIFVHSVDVERVNELFIFVLCDFPEIFWCEGSISTEGHKGVDFYAIARVRYSYSYAEAEEKKAGIEAAVNQCLAGISQEDSTYDKIKYVYDWIIGYTEYDLSAPDNQNISSVFVGKRSVCAGYARATQYILERLGIFCTYVVGTAVAEEGGVPESHAWNLVQIDDEYYYVDTTWGDPVFVRDQNDSIPVEAETTNYDYLCTNDEELFTTHTPGDDVPLPSCTSTAYDYYRLNHCFYDSFDEQALLKAMNRVIGEKGNPVRMKFATPEIYQEAKTALTEELCERSAQHLMTLYGLNQVRYYYQTDDRMRKVTIYWEYE